jgi:hypothetical protein
MGICIYNLGKIDAIYKMQVISLYIIDNMADNFLNDIKESPNLNMTDDQYGLIHAYMYHEVFNSMDSIPMINAVNSTFKTVKKEEKQLWEQ